MYTIVIIKKETKIQAQLQGKDTRLGV